MIPFLLDQYLEETAILSTRRVWYVEQPHVGLSHLIELDRRIDAHLDGLVEAAEPAWDRCCEDLQFRQPGEFFAAAYLAIRSGKSLRIDRVLTAADGANELVAPIAMALGWRPWEEVANLATEWMHAGGWHSAVGLSAHLIHGVDPGAWLSRAVNATLAAVRSIALRGVGQLGRVDLLDRLVKRLTDKNKDAARWAAWSVGLLRGDEQDIARMKSIVTRYPALAAWYLPLIVTHADCASLCRWRQELQDAAQDRVAIALTARMGFCDDVPWLIEKMADPHTVRCAAEAFTTITGLRIQGEDLELPGPDGFESGPTDDPRDDDVSMDSEEYLPWPNVTAVTDWWNAHQSVFSKSEPYLLGRPRTADWSEEVLRVGMQRERFQAALNLALHSPGRNLFDVRAPADLQCERLRTLPSN